MARAFDRVRQRTDDALPSFQSGDLGKVFRRAFCQSPSCNRRAAALRPQQLNTAGRTAHLVEVFHHPRAARLHVSQQWGSVGSFNLEIVNR